MRHERDHGGTRAGTVTYGRSPLSHFVTDVWVLTKRSIARIRREPETLADVTFQPVMFILMFAYVFGGAILRAAADRVHPLPACRKLFGNPNPAAAIPSWPMQHPELAVLCWSAAMLGQIRSARSAAMMRRHCVARQLPYLCERPAEHELDLGVDAAQLAGGPPGEGVVNGGIQSQQNALALTHRSTPGLACGSVVPVVSCGSDGLIPTGMCAWR